MNNGKKNFLIKKFLVNENLKEGFSIGKLNGKKIIKNKENFNSSL